MPRGQRFLIRRRSTKVVAALAAAFLVFGACTLGDDPEPRIVKPGGERPRVPPGLARAPAGGLCDKAKVPFQGTLPNGKALCTHGYDPIPAGVDVDAQRSVPPPAASTVPCIGNGTDGPRVQALYVHPDDKASEFQTLLPTLRAYAAQVEDVVSASAERSGGERHVRFVTTPDCNVDFQEVEIAAAAVTGWDPFVDALYNAGYDRTDRLYLVWMDSNYGVTQGWCGIGGLWGDDSPAITNKSNSGPNYGRTERDCWGAHTADGAWGSVEAHELLHTIGAVNYSAPNAHEGHCKDEYDRMCYGAPDTVYKCPESSEKLLDCGHDDYFSAAPNAGNYLATYWNSANSVFLEGALAGGDGGGGGDGDGDDGGGDTGGTAATTHPRGITLRLVHRDGRLVLRGNIFVDDGFFECSQSQRVEITRNGILIATPVTNVSFSAFKVRVRDRVGGYTAYVAPYQTETDSCPEASASRRHSH